MYSRDIRDMGVPGSEAARGRGSRGKHPHKAGICLLAAHRERGTSQERGVGGVMAVLGEWWLLRVLQ